MSSDGLEESMSNSENKAPENKGASPEASVNHELLFELWEYRMPFGKYKGLRLVLLPEPYVVWFSQQGFPHGKLGDMLRIVYEIKVNGLEYLFDPLKG